MKFDTNEISWTEIPDSGVIDVFTKFIRLENFVGRIV